MRIINLCAQNSCCPVVKIGDEQMEIGEKDNLCKAAPKPDDPCPCGSGKPYRDCCGKDK